MKNLKSIGLALAAMLALSALLAGSAVARKASNPWLVFSNCPVGLPELAGCTYAKSEAGSYFQAGKITVALNKPIVLLGGFDENEAGEQLYRGPEHGNAPISLEAQAAPSLTEVLSPEALPEPERARYEAYLVAGKSTKVTATVEIAGPPSSVYLNELNLLLKANTFLALPVQVHLNNKFLGENCSVGTNYEPINLAFTDGTTNPPPPNMPITGKIGKIKTLSEGRIQVITGDEIVNNEYAAPGVSGCGEGGKLDGAINAALGLPSPAGSNTAVILGYIEQAGPEAVREQVFGY